MKTPLLFTTSSLLGFVAATALILSACQTGKNVPASTGSAAAPNANSTPHPRFFAAESGKSGMQLWSENCVRCHNDRSPASYNDAQWDVVMMHMRVRANLTAEEHRKILEFLQSAN